jgi:Low psii accumulation1 / Rep27
MFIWREMKFCLVALVATWHTLLSLTSAFVIFPGHRHESGLISRPVRRISNVNLFASEEKKAKKGGLDETVRTKLVSESIAPWRTFRLFLYFSLGSGALVGGLVTLTGTAAILSGAKEGDMNTEVSEHFMILPPSRNPLDIDKSTHRGLSFNV